MENDCVNYKKNTASENSSVMKKLNKTKYINIFIKLRYLQKTSRLIKNQEVH